MYDAYKPQSAMRTAGNALAGFSAGLQGRGQEFAAGMDAQRQQLSQQRMQAMAQDALQVYQLLESGDPDSALQLVNQRVELIKQLGGDPSDTLDIQQKIATARFDEAKSDLSMFLSAAQQAGLIQAPEKPEAYTLSPGQVRYQGQTPIAAVPEAAPQEPGAVQALRIRAREAGLIEGTQAYADFMRTGGGDSGVSVTTNVQGPMGDKYLEGRESAQAATMAELEKSAESAYRANQALDRFIASSATGDAGGAQPLITGVKSFLSSFGYDPEGLTDTAVMQQAVGDILGAKMAELGARGLTDKDMEILRQALPRVDISHEARVQVADIIKRANQNTLREYDSQVRFEEETYPQANFRRPSWLPSVREQLQQETPVNDPLGILQ